MRKTLVALAVLMLPASQVLAGAVASPGVMRITGDRLAAIEVAAVGDVQIKAVNREALLRSLGLKDEDVELMAHADDFAARLEELDASLDEAYSAYMESLSGEDEARIKALEARREQWAALWGQATGFAASQDAKTRKGQVLLALVKHSLTGYVSDAELRLELMAVRKDELAKAVDDANDAARTKLAALSVEDRKYMNINVLTSDITYDEVLKAVREREEPKSPIHTHPRYEVHLQNAYDAMIAWKGTVARYSILASRYAKVRADHDRYLPILEKAKKNAKL